MRILLLVGLGAAGTLARYALQGAVQYRTGSSFPTGTLVVNVLGCFVLGGIGRFALQHLSFPPDLRVGIMVGFVGAFTTFSTFSWEIVLMLQDGERTRAGAYLVLSVVGGLLAVLSGMRLADLF